MPSISFDGYLTSETPLMITRPESDPQPLTMVVNRNEMATRVYAVPGETCKGLLRGLAYLLCVDAGLKQDANLKVSLDSFYQQTAGGLVFAKERKEIGEDIAIRQKQFLISLFGAASPKLTGRIIVQPAIARETIGLNTAKGVDLPQGTRRDAMMDNPEYATLLTEEDKVLWAKRNVGISEMSSLNFEWENAKRAHRRAKKTEGIDPEELKKFKEAEEELEAKIKKMKDDPDFSHAVQRIIPYKQAAPAGIVYDHSIQLMNASLEEIGLFLAVLDLWNVMPRIGGGRTTGYGKIKGNYTVKHLTGSGLLRDQEWVPVAEAQIGYQKPVISSPSGVIAEAVAAWRAVEADILNKSKIFA